MKGRWEEEHVFISTSLCECLRKSLKAERQRTASSCRHQLGKLWHVDPASTYNASHTDLVVRQCTPKSQVSMTFAGGNNDYGAKVMKTWAYTPKLR
mmetsp:Transcript_50103/g.83165  ORF Transcript_50103/g.83165 Transcript_50103/m.83165 type:complete len:96 (-) Transcript_50103:14-301(-)